MSGGGRRAELRGRKMDFRVGGKFLCCIRMLDGQEFGNAGENDEIVPQVKIVSSITFPTRRETRFSL